MLTRILWTPATALALGIHRSTAAGQARDQIVRRAAHAAALTVDQVEAIVRRELMPSIEMGADVAGLASAVGIDPREVCYRSLMVRGEDEPDEDSPRYRFTMSTATEDRASDIVEQDWHLAEFEANPIAPFGHRYWDPAIGRWHNVGVEGGRLTGDLEPVPLPSYPLSVTVAEQLRLGVLNTVSVGFMPRSVIPRASLGEEDPRYGERGYLFVGNVLHECSVVPVPMNAEATAQRKRPAPEIDPQPEPERHWLFGA